MLGTEAEHLALTRLVSVGVAEFAGSYWSCRALLSPAATLPRTFDDLLDAAAVDELISRRGLRTPFLRVAKAGSTLADKAFTAGGGVGATVADQLSDDRLSQLFADGSTLVLQALHRTWGPVIDLCQQLASELGHPVQANAYITPPQNQGFSAHYDVHDVFVLQIEGEKHWLVHAPVLDAPLRDQPWPDRRTAVERRATEPPLIDTILRPGDCLYLPRGFLHSARALGGISTHLTLGVHVWTRHAIAEQLVQHALRTLSADVETRRSLPLGVHFDGDLAGEVDLVREALVAAVGSADLDSVAAALRRQRRQTQRAAPVGPLRQFRAADALSDDTVLHLRRHLDAALEPATAGRSLLRSRAGDVTVAASERAAVVDLLATGEGLVASLGRDLARRLLVAGVLVAG